MLFKTELAIHFCVYILYTVKFPCSATIEMTVVMNQPCAGVIRPDVRHDDDDKNTGGRRLTCSTVALAETALLCSNLRNKSL